MDVYALDPDDDRRLASGRRNGALARLRSGGRGPGYRMRDRPRSGFSAARRGGLNVRAGRCAGACVDFDVAHDLLQHPAFGGLEVREGRVGHEAGSRAVRRLGRGVRERRRMAGIGRGLRYRRTFATRYRRLDWRHGLRTEARFRILSGRKHLRDLHHRTLPDCRRGGGGRGARARRRAFPWGGGRVHDRARYRLHAPGDRLRRFLEGRISAAALVKRARARGKQRHAARGSGCEGGEIAAHAASSR